MLTSTPDYTQTPHTTSLPPCRGRLPGLRVHLAAIAVVCLAAISAPQALAQCGAATPLTANQWKMVAVSCVPAGASTVSSLFTTNANLSAANYNVTWVVWKRLYSTNPAPVNDTYSKLTLASAVAAGDALWIYTTTAVANLQFTGTATPTGGTNYEMPVGAANYLQLSTSASSRYYMFGNPYATTKTWNDVDIRWPALLYGFINYLGTTQEAIDNNVVSKDVYYWNGTNTYFTRDNTSSPNPQATFTPKQAAWLELEQPASFITNVKVRVIGP